MILANPGSRFRWRIPAFTVGILQLIQCGIILYGFIRYMYLIYDDHNDRQGKTLLRMGLILVLASIPFNIVSLIFAYGLTKALFRNLSRKYCDDNDSYDIMDEADEKLQKLLKWRSYNIFVLVVYALLLIFSVPGLLFSLDSQRNVSVQPWIATTASLLLQYVFLIVVKQHVVEMQEFIDEEERKEKLEKIRIREKFTNSCKLFQNKSDHVEVEC